MRLLRALTYSFAVGQTLMTYSCLGSLLVSDLRLKLASQSSASDLLMRSFTFPPSADGLNATIVTTSMLLNASASNQSLWKLKTEAGGYRNGAPTFTGSWRAAETTLAEDTATDSAPIPHAPQPSSALSVNLTIDGKVGNGSEPVASDVPNGRLFYFRNQCPLSVELIIAYYPVYSTSSLAVDGPWLFGPLENHEQYLASDGRPVEANYGKYGAYFCALSTNGEGGWTGPYDIRVGGTDIVLPMDIIYPSSSSGNYHISLLCPGIAPPTVLPTPSPTPSPTPRLNPPPAPSPATGPVSLGTAGSTSLACILASVPWALLVLLSLAWAIVA